MEDGLNIVFHEDVFTAPKDIFQRLEKEITYLPEDQCRILIKNKSVSIPRNIVAFGDSGLTYTFSGLTLSSQPWTPLLLEIKNEIENLLGFSFNFLLINRYENGNDCIGQHKDDESDLDENYPICSLSFGETRTMIFKRPGFPNKNIVLKSNSLLLMNPPTNQLWTHGIPREKNCKGIRINLTFRVMKVNHNGNRKRKQEKDLEESSKKTKKVVSSFYDYFLFKKCIFFIFTHYSNLFFFLMFTIFFSFFRMKPIERKRILWIENI